MALCTEAMALAPSPVRMTRIPIDVSARYMARARGRAETAFDLGVLVGVLLLETRRDYFTDEPHGHVAILAVAREAVTPHLG